MKKLLISLATGLFLITCVIILESEHGIELMFTCIFFLVFMVWPVVHAILAKDMPFFWVLINFSFGIVGYCFFLFFLINKEKLNLPKVEAD